MNRQDDELHAGPGLRSVAPIFRLLGEGRLGPDALDAVTAVLEADGLPPVSQARLARACRIAYRPRPVERPGVAVAAMSGLRRLLATLVVEPFPRAQAAGVRGAGLTGCRLLFTADGYEVVVQESANTRRVGRSLIGQILLDGDPVLGATVLLANASWRSEVEVDDEGSFRFPNVVGGDYELDVRTGDDQIVCTPVRLDDR